MAEMEPGHSDLLCQRLNNWLREANDPHGRLPVGMAPTEWAVRQFIDTWRGPLCAGIDSVEESLRAALVKLKQDDRSATASEIQNALHTLSEDVRNNLGLYEWNRESEGG